MSKAKAQTAIIEAPVMVEASLATVNLPIIGCTCDYSNIPEIEYDDKGQIVPANPADFQTSQIYIDCNDVSNPWANDCSYAPYGAMVTPDDLAVIQSEGVKSYSPLMVVSNKTFPSEKWVWYSLTTCPEVAIKPGTSKVQTIKLQLDGARYEETQERRYQIFLARCLTDLDRICVNPLIATLQSALQVAEADLLACQVLLQDKLADLSFVRSELTKLTGKTIKTGKAIVSITSNRSRANADRFGLVGNESAFMAAVVMGPCTMTEALERCGQRWPQTKLAQRMIEAGHLVKSGNTYSVRS